MPGGGTRVRLFCFPPAGVGADAFRCWDGRLDPSIEPVYMSVPRTLDPAVSWTELTDHMSGLIDDLVDGPYAFYGHSFGGRLAYELSLARTRRGRRPAEHLFVGACRGPDVPQRTPYMYSMPEPDLLAALGSLGGDAIPELGPAAMQFMLRTLRRDLRLAELWFRPEPVAVEGALTAIYGTLDEVDDWSSMAVWPQLSRGGGALLALDAGHHFMTTHPGRVCAIINDRLGPWLNG